MEKQEEKIHFIIDCYSLLRAKGFVKTQGDFANLLGVNQTTISMAKAGKEGYLTDNLVSKVGAKTKALVGELPDRKEKVADKGVFVPLETIEMYTSMARSIETLSGMVDKLTAEVVGRGEKGAS